MSRTKPHACLRSEEQIHGSGAVLVLQSRSTAMPWAGQRCLHGILAGGSKIAMCCIVVLLLLSVSTGDALWDDVRARLLGVDFEKMCLVVPAVCVCVLRQK